MKEDVIRKLTAAASLGFDMSKQIENYDNISLDDTTEALSKALGFAEALTGRDFSDVRVKTDQIVGQIRNDSTWSAAVNVALKELNEFQIGKDFNLLPDS